MIKIWHWTGFGIFLMIAFWLYSIQHFDYTLSSIHIQCITNYKWATKEDYRTVMGLYLYKHFDHYLSMQQWLEAVWFCGCRMALSSEPKMVYFVKSRMSYTFSVNCTIILHKLPGENTANCQYYWNTATWNRQH